MPDKLSIILVENQRAETSQKQNFFKQENVFWRVPSGNEKQIINT